MKSFSDIVTEINEALKVEPTESETLHLSEAIHPDVQKVLDNSQGKGRSAVLSSVSNKVRDLISRGEDPGMEGDPKGKGSSRVVFTPTEHRNVEVDGVPTKAESAVKVAFKNELDPHHSSDMTLGEHQNEAEADGYLHKSYSVLRPIGDGKFESNENGVFPPLYDQHPENRWIEMGKTRKMSAKDFKELTKTDSHPKGLDFKKVADHLNAEYQRSQGKNPYTSLSEDEEDHIASHPFVENLKNAMFDLALHPGDIALRNMGIWKHPVTGKEYPVMNDAGANESVMKLYNEARKKKYSRR